MADKSGTGSGENSNIQELREYFGTLNTSQKGKFIQNLQQKLGNTKSTKYEEFLSECIQTYQKEKEIPPPDISPESFAIALASMLNAEKAGSSGPAIGPQLVGTWQRERDGKTFYYKFNEDGTFETNEVAGHENLTGSYKVGDESAIHMEPHELLQVNGLMLSISGSSLTVSLMDGSSYDYRRKE